MAPSANDNEGEESTEGLVHSRKSAKTLAELVGRFRESGRYALADGEMAFARHLGYTLENPTLFFVPGCCTGGASASPEPQPAPGNEV